VKKQVRLAGIKTLFGNVVAGDVHPQPHISVFSKASKTDFAW